MNPEKQREARGWFEELRDILCSSYEAFDNSSFVGTRWKHKWKGGGLSSSIKGNVIEKGGVNTSTVEGEFSQDFRDKIPGTENSPSYFASGISVVLHPLSPHIPSMHFNTRYLETEKSWFGGGIDITPSLNFEQEAKEFHTSLHECCNRHSKDYYPKFSKWCDEYFYLPHRKERRGIGGIFFDYHNTENWEKDFSFVKEIGRFFHHYSKSIIEKYHERTWNESEKEQQLIKRGRYAEFNLLYDRGTRFGLETGGSTEAILMSLPPLAKWQ